jgi:hypothetical protein
MTEILQTTENAKTLFTKRIISINTNVQDIHPPNDEHQNLKLALYVSNPHNVSIQKHILRNDMNIAKNMEAVFVAIVILAGIATYATAKVAPAPAPAAPAAAAPERMVTIVVSTKRLTAAQKAALDS